MFPAPCSRRDVLRLGIFASAALASIAGTAHATAPSTAPGVRFPTLAGAPGPGEIAEGLRGGTVTTVWSSPPMPFDPATAWDLQGWEAITQLIYTPLLQYQGQNGAAAPSAAAEMPTFSKDSMTATIKLRPGVKFHNGREVIAQDYVYSWTRVLDPELLSWASSYLLGIEGAQAVYDGEAKTLSGVKALDKHTLQVKLVAPDITFLSLLCQPYMSALPREEIEAKGVDGFGRAPVGNGPFICTAWDDSTRSVRFERNPDYFWAGTPFLDAVVYRWGITDELQLLQLQGGVADIGGNGLSANQAALLLTQGAKGDAYRQSTPILGTNWLSLNQSSGPLQDPRVRRALNLATDRKQLARATFGTLTPGSAAFPDAMPDFVRTAEGFGYDPDQGRRLMEEAGQVGVQLEFIHNGVSPWPAFAQILQQQWALIGVELKISGMGTAAFAEAMYNQIGDVYGTGWFMVQPSALDVIDPNWVTGGSSNLVGYSNEKLDALAAEAKAAGSVRESNALIAQIEQLLQDDAAGVFLGSMNFMVGRNPELQNFQYRGESGTYYDRIWLSEGTS